MITPNPSTLAFGIKTKSKLPKSEGKNYYQLRLYLDRCSLIIASFYFKYKKMILKEPFIIIIKKNHTEHVQTTYINKKKVNSIIETHFEKGKKNGAI